MQTFSVRNYPWISRMWTSITFFRPSAGSTIFSILIFTFFLICLLSVMSDPLDHATGIEKRELLARAAGNEDPFDMKVFKRGPGTKEQPNLVPSAFDARLVGCICKCSGSLTTFTLFLNGEHCRRRGTDIYSVDVALPRITKTLRVRPLV